MEEFLMKKAKELDPRHFEEKKADSWWPDPIIKYSEDICNDYNVQLHYDSEDKSYIYGIGCLSIIDGNKSDWVDFYLAYKRDADAEPEFIGNFSFPEGENTAIDSTINRIKKTMRDCWW